jgi:hypothetical protein
MTDVAVSWPVILIGATDPRDVIPFPLQVSP